MYKSIRMDVCTFLHLLAAPDGPLVIRLKSLASLSSPATSPRSGRLRTTASQNGAAQNGLAGSSTVDSHTVLKQWIQSRLGTAVRILLAKQALGRDVAAAGYGYMHWRAFREEMNRLGPEVGVAGCRHRFLPLREWKI